MHGQLLWDCFPGRNFHVSYAKPHLIAVCLVCCGFVGHKQGATDAGTLLAMMPCGNKGSMAELED